MVGFFRRITDKKGLCKASSKHISPTPSPEGPECHDPKKGVPPSLPSLPPLPPLYARFATTEPQNDTTGNVSSSPLLSLKDFHLSTFDLVPDLSSSVQPQEPDVWNTSKMYSVNGAFDLIQSSLPPQRHNPSTSFSASIFESAPFATQDKPVVPTSLKTKPNILVSSSLGGPKNSTMISTPPPTVAPTVSRQVRADQLNLPSKPQSPSRGRRPSISSSCTSSTSYSVSDYYGSTEANPVPKLASMVTPGFRHSTLHSRQENQVQPVRHAVLSHSPAPPQDTRPPSRSPSQAIHVQSGIAHSRSFVSSRNYASDSTNASRQTVASTTYTSGSSMTPVKKQSDVTNLDNPTPHQPSPSQSYQAVNSKSVSWDTHHDSRRPTRPGSSSSTSRQQPAPTTKINLSQRQSSNKPDPSSRYPSPPPSRDRTYIAARQPPVINRAPKEPVLDALRQSQVHTNPINQPLAYSVTPPVHNGPLIFAAMAAVQQPADAVAIKPATTRLPEHDILQHAYPSPPKEHVLLADKRAVDMQHSVSSASSNVPLALKINDNKRYVYPPNTPTHNYEDAARLASSGSSRDFSTVQKPSNGSSLERGVANRPGSAQGQESHTAGSPKSRRVLTKPRPVTPSSSKSPSVEPTVTKGVASQDALLFDADPFARVDGVKLLKTASDEGFLAESSKEDLPSNTGSASGHDAHDAGLEDHITEELPVHSKTLPTPLSPPADYKAARAQRRGVWLDKSPPPLVADIITKHEHIKVQEAAPSPPHTPPPPPPPPTYFPIVTYMADPSLLQRLLEYLTYSDWSALWCINKEIRTSIADKRLLKEEVLERYLGTVGYKRWTHEWAEPLVMSLKDLDNYMRGVSMPTHQYARVAGAFLQPRIIAQDNGMNIPSPMPDVDILAASTRSYTRVVLRLRAQAEAEAKHSTRIAAAQSYVNPSTSTRNGHRQHQALSRAPSPTSSQCRSRSRSRNTQSSPCERSRPSTTSSSTVSTFHSPLFKLHRAPLLRVFVPSPEGEWLSDSSVLECEAELKRAGVLKLLRVGDVVWDVAVGDEGNIGRMVWDGRYLIDLDYKYSRAGDLPQTFHSLAFSPSYFHRVIRSGHSYNSSNPTVYLDVSPWGREMATNLQLLQDRVRTETPQGMMHNVVRWIHRTSFDIRKPTRPRHSDGRSLWSNLRLQIPHVEGFFIDPGWYGMVVIEAEGTNEGLADLQERCGPGVFPPRPETVSGKARGSKQRDNKRVFRLLRENSRPGQIWLRMVREKERLM